MNTASRLESYDKDFLPPDPLSSPCRILVGDTTMACLDDGFQADWVGDLNLKGKEQTVGVYRVTAHRAAPAPELVEGRPQA